MKMCHPSDTQATTFLQGLIISRLIVLPTSLNTLRLPSRPLLNRLNVSLSRESRVSNSPESESLGNRESPTLRNPSLSGISRRMAVSTGTYHNPHISHTGGSGGKRSGQSTDTHQAKGTHPIPTIQSKDTLPSIRKWPVGHSLVCPGFPHSSQKGRLSA